MSIAVTRYRRREVDDGSVTSYEHIRGATRAAADVAEAAERMRRGSLSVVEGPRLAGMLTEIDVLRSIGGGDVPGSPDLDIVIPYP